MSAPKRLLAPSSSPGWKASQLADAVANGVTPYGESLPGEAGAPLTAALDGETRVQQRTHATCDMRLCAALCCVLLLLFVCVCLYVPCASLFVCSVCCADDVFVGFPVLRVCVLIPASEVRYRVCHCPLANVLCVSVRLITFLLWHPF